MLAPQEISMIVSSAPNAGATNISSDGSYFEISLGGDGLAIPKDALSATLEIQGATIWWVSPNILTGINDKMYITGVSGVPTILSRVDLGYPPSSVYEMTIISPNLSILSIGNIGGGMPTGDFLVGDFFRPDSGISAGVEYEIIGITNDTAISKTYTVVGLLESNILANTGAFSRARYNTIQNYVLTIPQGLYDLNGLNNRILLELENQGAKIDPSPLISFSPDEATQKVSMRVYYDNVVVDFTQQDTPREILGFDNALYGTYLNAPVNILAPNIAGFNTVNSFLIHSDLVNRGIRFNNDYNQTVAQVLIDVSPGSQIVYAPFNPPKVECGDLINSKRNLLRFWLTDDRNRRVNTNGEYWTARLLIRYLRPLFIGEMKK